MANHSTNINTTNNLLSPQSIEHRKTTTYGVGYLGPGLRHILWKKKQKKPLDFVLVRNNDNLQLVELISVFKRFLNATPASIKSDNIYITFRHSCRFLREKKLFQLVAILAVW
jgi:hypothetical protein